MKTQLQSRPTIHDVAKMSGLSLSTVSLVLNNKSNVSKEARKRVQDVITELNYHPRRSARGLASQSSGNFGFILTDDHFSLEEPFYTRIFLGSELEARKHQYYILLTTVSPTVRETKEMPRFFLEQNVDGIIIAGKIGGSWIEYIQERSLPIILIDYELQGHPVSTVTMDNRGGVTLVMEHFFRLGHTKIGFIGGDLRHPSIAERYRAFGDEMKYRDYETPMSWTSINEPDTRIENGYRAAQQIFERASERPTAIFAANDALALGCLKYCREHDIAVPESLAIIGFDNVESGLHVEPRLTTVNVHREEMGGIAVRRLAEMVEEQNNAVVRTTTPVELVIRESCGGKSNVLIADPTSVVD